MHPSGVLAGSCDSPGRHKRKIMFGCTRWARRHAALGNTLRDDARRNLVSGVDNWRFPSSDGLLAGPPCDEMHDPGPGAASAMALTVVTAAMCAVDVDGMHGACKQPSVFVFRRIAETNVDDPDATLRPTRSSLDKLLRPPPTDVQNTVFCLAPSTGQGHHATDTASWVTGTQQANTRSRARQ